MFAVIAGKIRRPLTIEVGSLILVGKREREQIKEPTRMLGGTVVTEGESNN